MKNLEDLDVQEFAEAIQNSPELRVNKIIHLALVVGPALFLVIILFLTYSGLAAKDGAPDRGTGQLVDILSAAHGVTLAFCLVMIRILAGRVLGATNLRAAMSRPFMTPGGRIDNPSRIFLVILIQTSILRLALLEGPALFGLVVCLIASVNGVLVEQPIYWVNTISFVGLVAYVVNNWPTADRVVGIFRARKEEAATLRR